LTYTVRYLLCVEWDDGSSVQYNTHDVSSLKPSRRMEANRNNTVAYSQLLVYNRIIVVPRSYPVRLKQKLLQFVIVVQAPVSKRRCTRSNE